MKKKKFMVNAMSFITLLSLGTVALVACNPGEQQVQVEKFAITWQVAKHAKVVIEGATELPKEMEADTVLAFSVTVDQGYKVSAVKAASKRVTAKNGVYSIKITKAMEISVEVAEEVGELAVTTKPTKLVYYAGDDLDLTGMVVTVSYGTGRTETIEKSNGTNNGYTVYPEQFVGGETEFEVAFGGKTVKVTLDQAVEFSVKIDPNGGTISDDYINGLRAKNLHNFAVSDSGVVSFTYLDDLTVPVSLPTEEQISRPKYSFSGWSETGYIHSGDKKNVNTTAQWQYEVIKMESVEIALESGNPLLVLKGKFSAADKVYLYLYEGNAHVEIKEETILTGQPGDDFEYKFDLTKLKAKSGQDYIYAGKWMDIRVNATVDGVDQSMELSVAEGSSLQVNTEQKLLVGADLYHFAVYDNRLKIVFEEQKESYTLSYKTEGDKEYVVIEATTTKADHFGHYAALSWYMDGMGETERIAAKVSDDGKYTLLYDLAYFGGANYLEKNAYAHLFFFEDEECTISITPQADIPFSAITNATTDRDPFGNNGAPFKFFTFNGKGGINYNFGTRWSQLMLIMSNSQRVNFTGAKLEVKDNKVYYSISGTATGFDGKMNCGLILQHNSTLDGAATDDQGDWVCVYGQLGVTAGDVTLNDGAFEVSICINDTILEAFKADSLDKWCLAPKLAYTSTTGVITTDIKISGISTEPIINDGVSMRIDSISTNTWDFATLMLTKGA